MKFNPTKHPRDSKGRFRSSRGRAKVSFRVSTRSATVTVGKTFPVIPGKVGLHLGVLARLENTSQRESYLSKLSNKVLAKVALAVPQRHREAVVKIIKRRKAQIGGVQIGQIGGQRRAGGIKVSQVRPARSGVSGVRSSNRKPRTRSVARAATRGKRVQ